MPQTMQIFMIYDAFRDMYNSDDERTISYRVKEKLYACLVTSVLFKRTTEENQRAWKLRSESVDSFCF